MPDNDWLVPPIHVQDFSGIEESMREANEERWRREEALEDAASTTSTGITALVRAAQDAEKRENNMLRWTIAGVVLAGIAAVASIIAIVVTMAHTS